MTENTSKTSGAGRGLTIAAAVVFLLGLIFGVVQLSNGFRSYQVRPSTEEIAGRYELLTHLEDLEEILAEAENPDELDADAWIRERLKNTRMTARQQDTFRDICESTLNRAKKGPVERETALNQLIREQISVRQQLSDREYAERRLRYAFVYSGVGIGIGALGGGLLLRAARKKKEAAQAAGGNADGILSNNQER